MRSALIRRCLPVGMIAFIAGACAGAPDEPARVWFEHPREGELVTGPNVNVVLGAAGVEITSADIHRPGTAHHHIFVNADLTPLDEEIPSGVTGILHLGRGQTEFLVEDLDPGEHRLIAVLADWNHVPLDPPAIDTIFITVRAPASDAR